MKTCTVALAFLLTVISSSAWDFCSQTNQPPSCVPCEDDGTFKHKCPRQCGNELDLYWCDRVCSDHCIRSECEYNEAKLLVCMHGCKDFYTGPYCQQYCPDRCIRCPQYNSSLCLECEKGRHGETCDEICNNCKDDMCYINGTCIEGCKSGLYGRKCDALCDKCRPCGQDKTNCKACDDGNGICLLGCTEGYFGSKCEKTCRPGCTHCDIETGECQQCAVGWFSKNCSQRCQNCENNLCKFEDGQCTEGCEKGFISRGTTCELKDTGEDLVTETTTVGKYMDQEEAGVDISEYLPPTIVCFCLCAGFIITGVWRCKRKKHGRKTGDMSLCHDMESDSKDVYATVIKRRSSPFSVKLNGIENNSNIDGIIYADLDLPPPTMIDGEPVIHCKEERTHYQLIDFSCNPGPILPPKIWENEDDTFSLKSSESGSHRL